MIEAILLICCLLIAYFAHRHLGTEISMMHWLTKRKIDNWKRKHRKSIDLSTETPLASGHIDANTERYQFIGCETDGTALLIDYQLSSDRKELNLYLKLADGRIFTLPNDANVLHEKRNGHDDVFSIGNFRFEILIPHSKWRITYNGWLRAVHPSNAPNHNDADDDECKHVIFTFFWNAASDPIAWPDNWSTEHLMRSLMNANVTETLDNWLHSQRGFDQCGAMFGQVSVDAEEPFEVNLPGVRRIRFGDGNREVQSVTVIGVGRDGAVFALSSIIVDDYNEGCFGFVRWANGDIWPIQRSEFHFNRLVTMTPNEQIQIEFSTATKNFSSTLHLQANSSVHICGEGEHNIGLDRTISAMIADLNGIDVNGFIICQQPSAFNSVNNSVEQSFDCTTFNPNIECDKTKLTMPFDHNDCQNESLCGGKGSSIGFLTKLTRQFDFDVPTGFVLTSTAFALQLNRHPHVDDAITTLGNVAHKRVSGSLSDACYDVCELFRSTEIVEEIRHAVTKAFMALKHRSDDAFRVAVRSSAVGEDGIECSAAGQNATYLGVGDIDQVLVAIRNCWASLFTIQSVSYRLQNIQSIRTQMAMVIQLMIPSEAAGVLFTRLPINNDPNKLLITGSFGLGESVVSGSVDPDVFVVLRGCRNNNLSILERKMGNKETRIEMNETNCTISMENDQNDRQKYCINDEQLLTLCQIGIRLEQYYGSARDIEWAVHQNRIYLLQSRPMTSTTAFSSWELLHQFDSPIMSGDDMHTFGNIGEVMPEAITPLTYSTLAPSLNRTMLAVIAPEKLSPLYSALCGSSHHRISLNVFNTFLSFVEPEISLTNRVHGLAVFGHEFIDERLHRLAVHRNGIGTNRFKLYLVYDLIVSMWQNKSLAKKGQQFTERFRGTYDAVNLEKFPTMHSLYDDLSKKIVEMDHICSVHSSTTKTATGYEFIIFRILAEGSEDLSAEFSNDISLMLSSCSDVESAEIPVMLQQIAECIHNMDKQNEFISIAADIGMTWLNENCHKAYELMQTFLDKHGHRAFAEFELSTITWGMQPALVIGMLQRTVQSLNDTHQRNPKKTLTNDEIVAALKSPKHSRTRKIISTFLPHIQTSVRLREQSKSCTIAYIHELRKGYRFLSEQMQRNGLLSDSDLIFYLTHQEIGRVLNERCTSLVIHAQRRKRLFPEWKKFRFDEFQSGIVRPLIAQTIENPSDCVRVKGTPVCEGNINGRACVVNDFSEVNKIKCGDILITHSTDIAWSPYFPILAGVVTELGGLISHGAVVAREYGLPCIVGATNATTIIHDGDTINMNAITGIVTKVEALDAT